LGWITKRKRYRKGMVNIVCDLYVFVDFDQRLLTIKKIIKYIIGKNVIPV